MTYLVKLLLFTVFVALGSGSRGIQELMYSPYGFISDLHRLCPENTTNMEQFRDSIEEAEKCYKNLSKSAESVCQTIETNILTCSQSAINYLTDCLPRESKDLPQALVDTATAVVETFCNSTGDVLIEVLNRCTFSYIVSSEERSQECKKIGRDLDNAVFSKFSKSEACLNGRKAVNCWLEHANQNCKNSKAKELVRRFSNAALVTCKK